MLLNTLWAHEGNMGSSHQFQTRLTSFAKMSKLKLSCAAPQILGGPSFPVLGSTSVMQKVLRVTLASQALPVGTRVRSRYAAPWEGVIVSSGADHDFSDGAVPVDRRNHRVLLVYVNGKGWHQPRGIPWDFLQTPTNVLVQITHDRRGALLRKPLWKVMDSGWLVPLPE